MKAFMKINFCSHLNLKNDFVKTVLLLDGGFEALSKIRIKNVGAKIDKGVLSKYVRAVIDSKRRPEEEVETMQWPEGNFTLLMPSDGCPLHPPAWNKGFVKVKEPPKDKYYPIDVPLHLANPHKKNGFTYRQFCILSASSERTQPWPAGSYCVYQFDGRCPTGFKLVRAQLHIHKDKANYQFFYKQPRYRRDRHLDQIFNCSFCCRRDGKASSPIDLPESYPFYLVRHGGRCQEVKGMDVTQDVFMMNTVETFGNINKWVKGDPDFRPDAWFHPYIENLCYYSRRKG